jgi:hypothetical protein
MTTTTFASKTLIKKQVVTKVKTKRMLLATHLMVLKMYLQVFLQIFRMVPEKIGVLLQALLVRKANIKS